MIAPITALDSPAEFDSTHLSPLHVSVINLSVILDRSRQFHPNSR
jgi:hypothetical protein